MYYLHRYKAWKHPSKYLTIIDDAMDQKTTCIPRVRRKTKATFNLATVGIHSLMTLKVRKDSMVFKKRDLL